MNLKRKHVGSFFLNEWRSSLHYCSCYFLRQSAPQNQPQITFAIDLKGLADVGIVQDSSVKVIQAYAGVPLKPIRNPCEEAC